MSLEQVLWSQVQKWKRSLEELEDMIDSAYEQMDSELEENRKEHLMKQIKKWTQSRDEMEDLLDGTYLKLDRVHGY